MNLHQPARWASKAAFASLLLLFPALLPQAAVPVPQPKNPVGVTIAESIPTYKWNRLSGVTRYHLQLRKGTTVLFTQALSASKVCPTSPCAFKHASALTDGVYRWRLRAYAGSWGGWSTLASFTVKTPSLVRVLNAQGSPIPQAAVRVLGAPVAQPVAGWTNGAGEFGFSKTGTGTLVVEVQAMGYNTRRIEQQVGSQGIQVKVTLSKGSGSPESLCKPEDIYFIARYVKMHLYDLLPYNPEVLIFGSSRAYTMPPAAVKNKTGALAYNASIGNGSILDGYYFAKFFFADDKGADIKVMLMELQIPGLNRDVISSITPIEVWPHIPDDPNFQPKIELCGPSFKLKTNTSYFNSRALLWAFGRDGMAVHKDTSQHQYNLRVEEQLDDALSAVQCSSLSALGMQHAEQLVALAADYGVKLVFYRPPYNSVLYDHIKDNASYQTCSGLMNDFMQDLEADHANVYFEDLSAIQLTQDGFAGFWDAHHYREVASIEIIDLLLADLMAALL